MPDCKYCDKSFDSEKKYLRHLKKGHDEDELSRVDRRRVRGVETESGYNTGAIILGVVIVGGFLAAIYVGYAMGSLGGSDEPHGTTHEHGLMEVIVDGEHVDLHQPQYVEQDEHFHFHDVDVYEVEEGELFVWHTHSHGVTLEYALNSLGFDVDEDGSEITIDGTTYDDSDSDTSVDIRVNGESVDITEYELTGGGVNEAIQGQHDDISVVATTGEE